MGGDSDAVRGPTLELLQIVREVVTEVAPEELPLLAALEQLPPDKIGRALARAERCDDPLGFGAGEIAAIATPILWAALQQVIDQMATAAADGTAARIRALLRTRFGRNKRSAQPIAHFGPAERDAVRDRVLEQARKLGMKPQRAELLALRVVERLTNSGSGG